MSAYAVLTALAILFTGFSVGSATFLALSHFTRDHYQDYTQARVMGLVLIGGLCLIQLANFLWLQADVNLVSTPGYQLVLFCIAPSFFLFSRPILAADPTPHGAGMLLHLVPVLGALLLPSGAASVALPAAFMVGALYLVWLAYGSADARVPLVHGEKFYAAVKKVNPAVEWVVYDGEGHGWALLENRVDFWTRVEKFLDQQIGH